jgi:hypothetical protein
VLDQAANWDGIDVAGCRNGLGEDEADIDQLASLGDACWRRNDTLKAEGALWWRAVARR